MPTERDFKGAKCRYYRDRFVWVSYSGNLLAYNYKGKTSYPKKEVHPNGRMYVKNAIGAMVYIDEAVIKCWCPPCPNDGKKYVVNHIDGDLTNNYYKNLEWVPYHYRHTTTDSVDIIYDGNRLNVSRDGTIKMDGTEVNIKYQIFDPDVGLFWYCGPKVNIPKSGFYNGYPEDVDEIMKAAGYVQGDDADMKCPKVIHKDNDWCNWRSDNLEFVEADDPLYQKYLDMKVEIRKQKIVELNPGKPLPSNYY